MKASQLLLVSVLSVVVAFVTTHVDSQRGGVTAGKESVYERIQRTGEIHCGYTTWNPYFYVDAATGEKKGSFHDAMEEVGKRLGFKVVWQEEIGWGSVVEAVKSGRVDMACSTYWLNPSRIKNLSSSVPQIYTPLYVYVRQEDDRSFNKMDDLNSDQLTEANIDGGADSLIVSKRFPKTKILALPELDSSSDEILSLLTKKADFIILDSATAKAYAAANPGKIRSLFPEQPIVEFPNVMLLPPNEPQLKEMIDDTLRDIEYDGTLDTILKTYRMEDFVLRNPKPETR